jgi:exosortase F-associated protein
MNKSITYILLFILFALLVLVRVFENDLFYDPYLAFFQNDYLYVDSPKHNVFKLTVHTVYRFIVNTVISLGILYLFFKDINVVKFSAVVYIIAFVTLISLYVYFVMNPKQEDYYMFFNIRRFLIQPIILLLLLPAFYYYKLKNRC